MVLPVGAHVVQVQLSEDSNIQNGNEIEQEEGRKHNELRSFELQDNGFEVKCNNTNSKAGLRDSSVTISRITMHMGLNLKEGETV